MDLSVTQYIKNEPEGTRTPDTRFRKPLLYPTELLVHEMLFQTSDIYNTLFENKMQEVFILFQRKQVIFMKSSEAIKNTYCYSFISKKMI